MTDQTKCPHCGAAASYIDAISMYYTCGTSIHDTATHQSDVCALRYLRAKVAAQQELLKECRDTLCVLGTAYALDLVDKIDAKLEEVK